MGCTTKSAPLARCAICGARWKNTTAPHDYIEFPHSGHGLQNDNDMGRLYNEKIEEYLETYLQ